MIPSTAIPLDKKPLLLLKRQLPIATIKIVRESGGRVQTYVKRKGDTYKIKPLIMITGKYAVVETQLNGYLPQKDVEDTIAKLQNSSFHLRKNYLLTQSKNEKIDFSPLLQKEKIGSLDQLERTITCHNLERLFENAPEETALNLSQLEITDPEAQAVALAIEKNPQIPLQELNLSHNQIGDAGAKALAQAIENNPQLPLQQLDLSWNQIREAGLQALAQAIEKNLQLPLQQLNLSCNKIGDTGARALTQAIEKNPQLPLQQLHLADNEIGDSGANALLKMIEHSPHPPLQTLNLDANQIGDEGIETFEEIYKTNRNLTTLSISSNKVGKSGKRAIERIEKYQSIKPFLNKISDEKESIVIRKAIEKFLKNDAEETRLNLSDKNIGNEGAKALAKALESNTSLKTLDLTNNPIGDEGVKALAKAYVINRNLQTLEIASDIIGEKEKRIMERIQKYQQIKPLINEISHKEKREIVCKAVWTLLKGDSKKIVLNLGTDASGHGTECTKGLTQKHPEEKFCMSELEPLRERSSLGNIHQIGNAGAQALAKALKNNQTLQVLLLSQNEIGNEGAKALAKALESNTSLKTLDLTNNPIGNEGLEALANAYLINRNLQILKIPKPTYNCFKYYFPEDEKFFETSSNKVGERGKRTIERMEKYQPVKPLINAISDEEEKETIRKVIEKLLNDDLVLIRVDLSGKRISDEGAKALAKALESNMTLKTLDLKNNPIGDEGVKTLAKAYVKNRNLQILEIASNIIGEKGKRTIERMEKFQRIKPLTNEIPHEERRKILCKTAWTLLKSDSKKIVLNLHTDASVYHTGRKIIFEKKRTDQQLHSLGLGPLRKQSCLDDTHQIGNTGARILAKALKNNQTLQVLDLECNEIGSAGAQALAKALENNQMLQVLNLTWNQIGSAGAQALAKALENNQMLQVLNLTWNQIGSAGAQALAKALENNQTLQMLNLTWNQIRSAGSQALAKALKNNQTLQVLSLARNQIDNEGAQALAQVIDINKTIQLLNLSYNNIEILGIRALAQAIGKNPQLPLQHLDLSYNEIKNAGAQALAQMIKNNPQLPLRQLRLAGNKIGWIGTKALALAIGNNVNLPLQQLDLFENRIAIKGARALAQMIENNHILQQLNISGRDNMPIGNIGLQALAGALENNTSLLNLDLPDFNRDPITNNQINILLRANNKIAATFSEQTTPIQTALKQPDPILLVKHAEKWGIDSKEIIPSLETIALQSGRKGLNEAHREKLQTTTDHLTHSLTKTLFDQFEDALALLSKKYFEETTTDAQRNLGHALYETWVNFFRSQCPNWLQTKSEEFTTLRLLLDIAENNTTPYNLPKEAPSPEALFHRLLAFKP